ERLERRGACVLLAQPPAQSCRKPRRGRFDVGLVEGVGGEGAEWVHGPRIDHHATLVAVGPRHRTNELVGVVADAEPSAEKWHAVVRDAHASGRSWLAQGVPGQAYPLSPLRSGHG